MLKVLLAKLSLLHLHYCICDYFISWQRESHHNPMVFIPKSVNDSVTLKDRSDHQAQKVARQQQETGYLYSA